MSPIAAGITQGMNEATRVWWIWCSGHTRPMHTCWISSPGHCKT